MSAARLLVAGVAALTAGCALQVPGEVPVTAVTGRISYVVDGRRPAWPAPGFTALRLESGDPYVTPAVDAADGGFRWNLPPGSYVISEVGDVPWPRVAFFVPAGSQPVYLGHLVLEGVTRGRRVVFTPRVLDEGAAGPTSLMLVDPAMPIGQALQAQRQASPRALIEKIFGASAPRLPE